MTSAQCPAITISKLLILLSLNLWFVNEAVELQSPFWQLREPQLTQGTASTTSGPPCLLVPGVPPTSPFLLPPLAGRTTRPLNQASVGAGLRCGWGWPTERGDGHLIPDWSVAVSCCLEPCESCRCPCVAGAAQRSQHEGVALQGPGDSSHTILSLRWEPAPPSSTAEGRFQEEQGGARPGKAP